MIYTVTLNPALDRTIEVEKLVDEDTIRIITETSYAGGKGIDVSRVVRALGGKSVALGYIGGYDGLKLEGLLINAGVVTDFTRIGGETRTNIIIKEREADRQFVISAAGPEISCAEVGALYQRLLELRGMEYLVVSGSLPRGVTSNFYGQIILAGKKNDAFVMLDADGRTLKESIEYLPTCIKPNRFELSRLVGRDLQTESELLAACDQLHEKGIPFVLLSRGKDGLVLSTPERKFKGMAPPVEVGSAVGAGDSSVGGFVLARSRGEDLEGCLRLACAAGTATAMAPGTELASLEAVEKLLPRVMISEL
ncbi:MAG: 1-phosphofructokinase [Syntrophobacteraceae bacterium]